MNLRRPYVSYVMKILGLLILDTITLLLVFSVWALINIPVFVLALIAIIFSLALVNTAILSLRKCVKKFGIAATVSALTATILYYLFVMFFTGITYISISPKWYTIIILITSLAYILIISGMYFSGTNKAIDIQKQEEEKNKVVDINLQILNIEQKIRESSAYVEKASYQDLVKAFETMNERFKSSTPFGRTTKEPVLQMEDKVTAKLSTIYDNLNLLNNSEESNNKATSISLSLSDAKNLIINREKMIVQ